MSLIPNRLIYKLKTLFKNPMVLFIYGIFAHWYSAILITVIVVTFWVFTGLKDVGLLQTTQDTVFKALKETKSVARYCVPKILHFGDFWDCLENPPEYEQTNEGKALERGLDNIAKQRIDWTSKLDPYLDNSEK